MAVFDSSGAKIHVSPRNLNLCRIVDRPYYRRNNGNPALFRGRLKQRTQRRSLHSGIVVQQEYPIRIFFQRFFDPAVHATGKAMILCVQEKVIRKLGRHFKIDLLSVLDFVTNKDEMGADALTSGDRIDASLRRTKILPVDNHNRN